MNKPAFEFILFKYYLKNTCHDYSKIKQQEALPEKQIEIRDSKTISLLSS